MNLQSSFIVTSGKGEEVPSGERFVREKDLLLTSHPAALPYYLVKE